MLTASVRRNAKQSRATRAAMAVWLLSVSLLLFCFPPLASAASFAGSVQPEDLEPSDSSVSSKLTASAQLGYLYIIQPGDDIHIIALAHGIPMEDLAAANDLAEPYVIQPFETLWVPADRSQVSEDLRQAQVIIPPPEPEPVPEPEPAPVAVEPATSTAAEPESAVDVTAAITSTAETSGTVAVEIAAAPAPAPEAATAVEATAAVVASTPNLPDGARLILDLMNEKRLANGLAPLHWSDQLAQAALAHAADCAQRGWGSHVGSDGASLRTRLARAGVYPGYASENWANARGAQQAFDMWWFEPPYGPHRLNILGPSYGEVGIGLVEGGWGYYVVADFGGD